VSGYVSGAGGASAAANILRSPGMGTKDGYDSVSRPPPPKQWFVQGTIDSRTDVSVFFGRPTLLTTLLEPRLKAPG